MDEQTNLDQSDHRSQQQPQKQGVYVMDGQEFSRDTNYIMDRIVADPAAVEAMPREEVDEVGRVHGGLTQDAQAWPVEAGRYRLVAARACPWANRAIIVRRLLGLSLIHI